MFDIDPKELAFKFTLACVVSILIFGLASYAFKSKIQKHYYEVKFTNGEVIKDSLRENWRSLSNDSISYQKSSMIYYKVIKK